MRRRGRGIGDWLKNAAGKVNNFLKSSKIVSRVAPILGDVLPGAAGQIANKVGSFAASHGYGRKRGRGPYRMDLPPFSAGRGRKSYRRTGRGRTRSRRGRGTPGMGITNPTTYPIATSTALPRF